MAVENDVIMRENLYRSLNYKLEELFQVRDSSDRALGRLLVMLLGVAQHTTSERFERPQLESLRRVLGFLSRQRITDSDLRDARSILSRSNFDIFRPFRGVFEYDEEA
jgi:hypothetical protein